MFTSIKDFVKSKKAENTTKIAKVVENASTKVDETKIADKSASVLESLVKNLSVCHFIINKGLINESSSLTSINEAIEAEFEVDNFFASEEEFNSFYVDTLESMKDFLTNEGFLDKIASVVNKTTNKSFVLNDELKATDKAQAFLNDAKYAKTATLAKQTLANKYKVPADKLDKALIAVLNWSNGQTPNFANSNVSYDAAKNELTIGSAATGAGAKVF